jgi:hypothetical protein
MPKKKTQSEIQKKHVISSNFQKHRMKSAYSDKPRSNINCNDGLTEQHHADQCNVNTILATYMQTGSLPSIDPAAQYGDLSNFDYQSLQNQIANAHSLFEELPDHVKIRFGNQPHRFLNFVQDEKNLDELIELGLANAPVPEDNNVSTEVDTIAEEIPRVEPASDDADRVVT